MASHDGWITLDDAEALTGRDEAEIYSAMRRGCVAGAKGPDATWRLDPVGLLAWVQRQPAAR